MERYYEIAGLTVKMDSFGRTAAQAEPYLCLPGQVDITIHSDWRSLQARQPELSEDSCEYIATGAEFYRQLLRFDGLLLHSSAVMLEEKAYLFSAPSGTGKSTHTKLWLEAFPGRAAILNDDKPALRQIGGVWYAFGTPWSGKYDISVNTGVPLAGIAMLERGEKNTIGPMDVGQAIRCLLEQTVRPPDPAYRSKLLELADRLLRNVSVWQLRCNMKPEAARVAYEAMRKTNY